MTEQEAALDRALTHFNEHDDVAALAALEPIVAAAVDEASPPDPRSFAGALYLQGLILHGQGRLETAFDRHRVCIERFVGNHHPVARECVIRCLDGDVIPDALRQHPELLARLPAAHHALRLPTNIEMVRTIEADMASATEARRDEAFAALERRILGDDARAGAEHERARAVLGDHFERGAPFGLYLWNLDLDAHEKQLVDGIPFIGLASGVDFGKDFAHAIPKLEVSNPWWETVLEILVRQASRIVFDTRHPSPGASTELELIASLGRAADTTVLVSDESVRAVTRAAWPAFERIEVAHANGR